MLSFTNNEQDDVLVDEEGNPRVGDFGLSRMMDDRSIWITSRQDAKGTFRWMSPELLNQEEVASTAESDIYAYAMTSLVS